MKLNFGTLSDGEIKSRRARSFLGEISRKSHLWLHHTKSMFPVQDLVVQPDLIMGKPNGIDDGDTISLDYYLALWRR